jgi:cell filamentation protein
MVPSDSDRLKEAREALEARYTIQRIAELEFRPVQGHFDAAHLKDIHGRIFQDLPSLGFTEVTPGQYRSAVPEGKAWTKDRLLSSINIHSYVTYSLMDNAAQARLDKILERADPHELSKHQAMN